MLKQMLKKIKDKKIEFKELKENGYCVYFKNGVYYTKGLLDHFSIPEFEINLPCIDSECAFDNIDYYVDRALTKRDIQDNTLIINTQGRGTLFKKVIGIYNKLESISIIFEDGQLHMPWDEECTEEFKNQYDGVVNTSDINIIFDKQEEIYDKSIQSY